MPLALFDLDGTLTDPKEGITRSIQYALGQLGMEVPAADSLTAFIGPPLLESFVRLAGLTPNQASDAVIAYREYFSQTGIFQNVPYDGIAQCLDAFTAAGWQLAVATSKPTVFAERILDHFSLRSPFAAVAGSDLDGTRVHKHEVISHALDMLDVAPGADCIMVGDRQHDIFGAKKVGLTAVGVTWGYGTVNELVSAGADLVVRDVSVLAGAARTLHQRPSGRSPAG